MPRTTTSAQDARRGDGARLVRSLDTLLKLPRPKQADPGVLPDAVLVSPDLGNDSRQSVSAHIGVQTLILDGYPTEEQQDVLGPNSGSRRWGVAAERKSVQATTWAQAKKQGLVKVPPPVRVTYTFVVPDNVRRDWDNYALICKPVQDGLVKAGIIVGDHFAVLDGRVAFRVEKGARRLEIEISPASGASDDAGAGRDG